MPTSAQQADRIIKARELRTRTDMPLNRCALALRIAKYDSDKAAELLLGDKLDNLLEEKRVKSWVREELKRQGVRLRFDKDENEAEAEDNVFTRDDALALAKTAAVQHAGDHAYLSHADKDPNWQPHEWVLAAIMEASANGTVSTPQLQPRTQPGQG